MKESENENCSGNGQCNCECAGKSNSDKDWAVTDPVSRRLCMMYKDLLHHDGFGDLQISVKILKRGQKEVIVKSGKEYRYVVDVPIGELNRWE
jgi:hypothetical protein